MRAWSLSLNRQFGSPLELRSSSRSNCCREIRVHQRREKRRGEELLGIHGCVPPGEWEPAARDEGPSVQHTRSSTALAQRPV